MDDIQKTFDDIGQADKFTIRSIRQEYDSIYEGISDDISMTSLLLTFMKKVKSQTSSPFEAFVAEQSWMEWKDKEKRLCTNQGFLYHR